MPTLPAARERAAITTAPDAAPVELTFVSWNVFGCHARRGFDPHLVAAVLLEQGADVAALQECGTDGGEEHAERIARSLGFGHVAFGANLERAQWRYGNAIISRYPLADMANLALPRVEGAEPRGCMTARVELPGGGALRAASAHLGLRASERARQARHLADELAGDEPLLLGADGNDWFPGADTRALRGRFADAWKLQGAGTRATYPARLPIFRLDHVYVASGVDVLACAHPDGPHIRTASDHRPVVARVRVAYYPACSRARVSSSSRS